jgi:hypothetical protein
MVSTSALTEGRCGHYEMLLRGVAAAGVYCCSLQQSIQ